jgi:hypothetical protein
MAALLYSYLEPIWSIGELSIAISGMTAALALILYMYGEDYEKVQKVSAKAASMSLISAITSMAIATYSPLMIGIVLAAASITIMHRQHYRNTPGSCRAVPVLNILS